KRCWETQAVTLPPRGANQPQLRPASPARGAPALRGERTGAGSILLRFVVGDADGGAALVALARGEGLADDLAVFEIGVGLEELRVLRLQLRLGHAVDRVDGEARRLEGAHRGLVVRP